MIASRKGLQRRKIAAWLNGRGLLTDLRRPWTRGTVHQILTNPKYCDANVYNRRSFKLKRKRVANPPEMWIGRDDAFVPIVPIEQFKQALAIIESRHTYLTDEQLLERLRGLLARIGPNWRGVRHRN
jgi:recombinase